MAEKDNQTSSGISYSLSIVVSFLLIVLGFAMQLIVGKVNLQLLSFPVNLIVLAILIIGISILHIFLRNNVFIGWLSSTKAAISSIVGFSAITLLMGFFSQEETSGSLIQNLGLNAVASTWYYLLSLLFLLIALGFATLRRIYPFQKKNSWYILNHLGLWITLVAANLGYMDQIDLRMNITTKEYSEFAFDKSGQFYMLPFKIKQTGFQLKNYNPKLAIMDNKSMKLSEKSRNQTLEVVEKKSSIIDVWNIKIHTYYESAKDSPNGIIPFDTVGTAPAAYVSVENNITHAKNEGWVSYGNASLNLSKVALDSLHSLVMFLPESKDMTLKLNVNYNNGLIEHKTIKINKPSKVDGWNVYIFTFDKQRGKWSTDTLIQLSKDPWLPLVYIGLIMMIIGSFFVFWRGKNN